MWNRYPNLSKQPNEFIFHGAKCTFHGVGCMFRAVKRTSHAAKYKTALSLLTFSNDRESSGRYLLWSYFLLSRLSGSVGARTSVVFSVYCFSCAVAVQRTSSMLAAKLKVYLPAAVSHWAFCSS